ncbi:alpha/beta fold hydrolase [Aeromicrobium wangtongii]|uniref:Alpha/beta hydrolase n=1 Tax=Aeromicrobium wangtongii TaxID=2969247 RepID=A0ABY5M9S1_9ACTN|nr:alpha/beta hydrolase [Aeromicrobium wangtongii]MCD9199513.1 alpha/beta hydrolase [Aeromicrobium wangtongii]UUP13866.1 alpha/beta hydrolase [Aeromicrobium wangtongii]
MLATERLNATVTGPAGAPVLVFAHGFGCDQNMWRLVAPAFESDFRVVLYDHVGAGGSDVASYDPQTYSRLSGYAADVIDLVEELDAGPVTFVGHSVATMIGVLAEIERPDLFDRLVLVGPSARYIDEGDYIGGFSASDIDELLESMDSNYLGWSHSMAPAFMGNADDPDLVAELEESFCRADPTIARQFAEVTFRSDNRADLPMVSTPALVLQCRYDVIAPMAAGEYVRDHLPQASYVVLDAVGHCPQLSAPGPTIDAIGGFLRS